MGHLDQEWANSYCDICLFFNDFNDKSDNGYCNRYPPIWIGNSHTQSLERPKWDFPIVSAIDKCGEYRQRGEE